MSDSLRFVLNFVAHYILLEITLLLLACGMRNSSDST